MWSVVYSKQAKKDARKAKSAGFKDKIQQLIEIIRQDPFTNPPPFERLVGDLKGAVSRRINIQHRLVYEVIDDTQTVKVLRMWTHYD